MISTLSKGSTNSRFHVIRDRCFSENDAKGTRFGSVRTLCSVCVPPSESGRMSHNVCDTFADFATRHCHEVYNTSSAPDIRGMYVCGTSSETRHTLDDTEENTSSPSLIPLHWTPLLDSVSGPLLFLPCWSPALIPLTGPPCRSPPCPLLHCSLLHRTPIYSSSIAVAFFNGPLYRSPLYRFLIAGHPLLGSSLTDVCDASSDSRRSLHEVSSKSSEF